MATGFDDLVEKLLYDVALAGSGGKSFEISRESCFSAVLLTLKPGLGFDELSKAVESIYGQNEQPQQPQAVLANEGEIDLLFSDAPPSSNEVTVIDDQLVDSAWDWLSRHSDVTIETVDGAASSSGKHPGERIFTTEARIWHSIAGHGVDHNRIPPKEFDLLSVVAAHGPAGVLQPDTTKITGQDKRSVPKRTDKLAEKGYIIKETVMTRQMKTSLLKLARFAVKDTTGDTGAPQQPLATPNSIGTSKGQAPLIYYDQWFGETVRLFQENDGLIAFEDLRIGLGIHHDPWGTKAFARCIRRLAEAGFLRRLKAKLHADDGPADGQTRWIRSLQCLREPKDSDRVSFSRTVDVDKPPNPLTAWAGRRKSNATEGDASLHFDSEADEQGNEYDEPGATVLASNRMTPQWTPDTSHNNFVYNIIESAGSVGIASMDLHARAMGPMWRRPLDEILLRLTDIWQTSQPAYLRHLGVVRDTDVRGKSSHFVYRTVPNFEKAVEEGKTTWEAILGETTSAKGKKKDAAMNHVYLDDWGFPTPNPQAFADVEGRASLLECSAQARQYASQIDNAEESDAEVDEDITAPNGSRPKRRRRKQAMKVHVPKRTLDPLRTPKPLVNKIRATSENDKTEYAIAVKGRAEMLAWAELNREKKKRTAEAAELDSTTKGRGSRKSRRTESDRPSPSEPLPDDPLPTRIQEIEADLLQRSKPGVYIHPPGARDMMFMNYVQTGRPPKAVVLVFKSERLKHFEWFKDQSPRVAPLASRSRINNTTVRIDDASPSVNDVYEGAQAPAREKQRLSVGATPPDSNMNRSFSTFSIDGGRRRKSVEIPAQKRLEQIAFGSAIKKPSRYSALRTADAAEPYAQNEALPTTSAFVPGPGVTTTPDAGTRTAGTQFVVQPPDTTTKLPPTGKSKRGGPSNAEAAERKAEQPLEAKQIVQQKKNSPLKQSLVVKLKLPAGLLRDKVSCISPPATKSGTQADIGNKITATSGQSEQDTNAIESFLVTLSLPRSVRFARARETEAGDTNNGSEVDVSQSRETLDVSRASRRGLVVLPLPSSLDCSTLKIVRPYYAVSPILGDPLSVPRKQRGGIETLQSNDSERVQQDITFMSRDDGELQAQPNEEGHEPTLLSDSEEEMLDAGRFDDSDDDYEPNAGHEAAHDLTDLPELIRINTQYLPKSTNSTPKKTGVARSGGSIQLQRANIVLETMKKAGGVFPGKRDMWYPFSTKWVEMHKQKPDRHTVDHVVDGLIEQGKLKRFNFEFTDAKGRTFERDIVILSNVPTDSEEVRDLQKSMISAFPRRYLPSGVEISEEMIDKAAKGWIPYSKKRPRLDDDWELPETPSKARKTLVPGGEYNPFEWDDFPVVEGATVKRTAQALAAKDQLNPGFRDPASRKEAEKSRIQKWRKTREVADQQRKFFEPSTLQDIDSDASKKRRRTPSESNAIQPKSTADEDGNASQSVSKTRRRRWKVGRVQTARNPNAPVVQGSFTWEVERSPSQAFPMKLLLDPGQQMHESSGTFGTIGIMTLAPANEPSFNNMRQECPSIQSRIAPSSLDDILSQAESLGRIPVDPSDLKQDQFFREVDMVNFWEEHVVDSQPSMTCRTGSIFINQGLNRELSYPNEKVKRRPIAFVDGFTRVTLAEKQRDSIQARDSMSNGPAPSWITPPTRTVKHSKHTRPSTSGSMQQSKSPSVPLSGQRLYPGPELPKQPLLPLAKPWPPPTASTSAYNFRPSITASQKGAESMKQSYIYTSRKKTTDDAHRSDNTQRADHDIVTEKADQSDTGLPQDTSAGLQRFQAKDLDRLFLAVALVGTLCSGVHDDRIRDWDIVAHALSFRYKVESLHLRWKREMAKDGTSQRLKRLRQSIFEPFLAAYEDGKLPNVDFSNPQRTDWPGLVLWAQKETLDLNKIEEPTNAAELPQSKSAMNSSLYMELVGHDDIWSHQVDFTDTEQSNKSGSVISRPFGTVIKGDLPYTRADKYMDRDVNDLMLAKSWARAAVATDDSNFGQAEATRKLAMLEPVKLDRATNQLLESKTILREKKGRVLTGRNYRLSTDAVLVFRRWQGGAEEFRFLRKVAAARTDLIRHFLEHAELELSPDVSEQDTLVLTNMVAQGHLKIKTRLPERNDDFDAPYPKLSKWGHPDLQQAYSRQLDPALFRFPVIYAKTAEFTCAHGLKVGLAPPRYPPAVPGETDLRIPFWIDIHGNFRDDIWDTVLRSVLHIVVFRPGITAKAIENAHKRHLWAWEIDLVLGWMEDVGIAVRCGAGKEEDGVWKGGWRAGDWWYCAFLPEVAGWQAPNGTVESV